MSIGRAIAHEARIARGTVKQFIGRAIGDTRLYRQGSSDRAAGNASRALDKLGNVFKR
ncbi:CsbD family protein [Nocardia tengchongensis]|uniref:CsbD family protein n=1 Tax=Nocardia tengchongensis TaxID=2055889 RepID=UPI00365FBFF5